MIILYTQDHNGKLSQGPTCDTVMIAHRDANIFARYNPTVRNAYVVVDGTMVAHYGPSPQVDNTTALVA